MGTESEYAVATPGKAFSAPGPYCMANTPIRRPLVVRLYPSAIPTPTRSCRQSTGRMPAAAAASMTGVVGYALRYSTPSRLRISATASTTFMPFSSGTALAIGADHSRFRHERLTGYGGGHERLKPGTRRELQAAPWAIKARQALRDAAAGTALTTPASCSASMRSAG